MTDTEKKIAEIREALESAMPNPVNDPWIKRCRFLLSELERMEREYAEERAAHNAHVTELCELEKENRKLRQERDVYYNNARYTEAAFHEVTSLRSQLQSAQQEIERLREENEGRKKIIEAYMRIEHDLAEDAERYLQQRDKLIEGLRWYADYGNWFPDKLGDGYIGDHGEYARNILKEIGVTVDV